MPNVNITVVQRDLLRLVEEMSRIETEGDSPQ